MKRGILLILMVLLVFNLAEDGCFGKAQFVLPSSTTKIFLKSFKHYDSGQIYSSGVLSSLDWRGMPSLRQSQLIMPRSQLGLKLINTCNHSSSGGIPR
jgi:hypothetical protein